MHLSEPVWTLNPDSLQNNCPFSVSLTLNNYPSGGADYTVQGPAIENLAASSSKEIIAPTRWNGDRIRKGSVLNVRVDLRLHKNRRSEVLLHPVLSSESNSKAFLSDYVSNIQGFSGVCPPYAMPFFVLRFYLQAQKVIPGSGCSVVEYTSAKCPCDQAYRPEDTSGTCGGTGPVHQAARVCGALAYTVVYCP
ncbi:hypothetical protein FB451DRAFT_1168421 [Mycena latifolia]|nr:hypothetical protein FB451DRAFT_1168421 [Mycena latifolia]